MKQICICAGEKTFLADIYDSSLAKSFMSQLPLTVKMERDEGDWFSPLFEKLLGKAEHASNVVKGDLAICNSISVSIFFEASQPGINYKRLGHVSNPDELKSALHECNGMVTFKKPSVRMGATA